MAIPLVGSPAPTVAPIKPALLDLLKGPAATFAGSIGGWAASGTGTTCAYDAAIGVDAAHGSAKLHTTTNATDRFASVTIPGTFKSGVLYHCVVLVYSDALASAENLQYQLTLGDQGAADKNTQEIYFRSTTGSPAQLLGQPPLKLVPVIVHWIPTANRTSVTLRISREATWSNNTHDLWIAEARVVAVPANSPGLMVPYGSDPAASSGHATFAIMPAGGNSYSGFGYLSPSGSFHIFGFVLQNTGSFHSGLPDLNGDYAYCDTNTSGFQTYAMGGLGRRNGLHNEEYGPDYVGIYKGERTSTEIDWSPDGDYDIYLLDGSANADTRHWWHEEADGAYKGGAGRKSRLGMYFQQAFHVTGVQTTGTAKNEPQEYWQMPFPAEIDEVRAHVGTAPTGATFIVDVNINGTTIFTTQANRPTIAISGTDATSGAPDTTKFAKNDRLSFDIDQVGSTIAGSDLTVMVRGRYLW